MEFGMKVIAAWHEVDILYLTDQLFADCSKQWSLAFGDGVGEEERLYFRNYAIIICNDQGTPGIRTPWLGLGMSLVGFASNYCTIHLCAYIL
jgi:hypothetical protein